MVEVAEKHIKIHVTAKAGTGLAGESVWAIDLGLNTARINNLPFFINDIGFGDIVRYKVEDGICEFQEVLKKVTTSWGVTWEPTDKTDPLKTGEEWKKIAKHLRANNVHFESAMAGVFVIALPVETPEEENIIWLKALKYSSPIELTLYLGDDEEDEDEEDSDINS